jgi:tetratricopeptide (TPR) repeat protein
MDVEDIKPGENFAHAIDQTLASCSTVLVVIGPHWHDILQARASRNEEDYVVHEIAAALTQKKTVVPVFVGGATVSSLTALPPALADLSFHQAVELHDTSFNDDCERLAKTLHLSGGAPSFLKSPILWLAAAMVIGLLLFAVTHRPDLQTEQRLKTATTQIQQREYESAFHTYEQIVTAHPQNRAALDGETDAAMLWLENFSVLADDSHKAEDIAAPILAQLKGSLEAALARTNGKGSRAADILAHLGWAHWLNEKIAFKEFGKAQSFFTQALAIDPQNVFANAFLGNWLLQTKGDSNQALAHFQTALAANKQRDLVRRMQLGGLYHNDEPDMRAALVKALNDIRIHHEPLDPQLQSRLSYLYSPTVSDATELHETLTAVAPDDAWKTFQWLNPQSSPTSDFVHANLTEISGNRAAALAEFKALAISLKAKGMNGRIADYTAAAVQRLNKGRNSPGE